MIRKRAFTLIELLVVIAIIGILSTIVLVSYNNVQERSRISQAKSDVNSIASAIKMMVIDTKEYPFHIGYNCRNGLYSGDVEVPIVNDAGAYELGSGGGNATDLNKKLGLMINDDSPNEYLNWSGPYADQVPSQDPWGRTYWLDSDYICTQSDIGTNDDACHGHTYPVSGTIPIRAIISYGSDGIGYAGDNISSLMCKY
ncbi:MAG: Type II secretion system protein G precursor [bacterium ADurb.Bin212]|nr:MAG: Type II secretion system protein G precursor [bacterium ADurb.Bin212]